MIVLPSLPPSFTFFLLLPLYPTKTVSSRNRLYSLIFPRPFSPIFPTPAVSPSKLSIPPTPIPLSHQALALRRDDGLATEQRATSLRRALLAGRQILSAHTINTPYQHNPISTSTLKLNCLSTQLTSIALTSPIPPPHSLILSSPLSPPPLSESEVQRLATDAAHTEKTMASLRDEVARLKASAQIQTHTHDNSTHPDASVGAVGAVGAAAAAAVMTKPGSLTVVSIEK